MVSKSAAASGERASSTPLRWAGSSYEDSAKPVWAATHATNPTPDASPLMPSGPLPKMKPETPINKTARNASSIEAVMSNAVTD